MKMTRFYQLSWEAGWTEFTLLQTSKRECSLFRSDMETGLSTHTYFSWLESQTGFLWLLLQILNSSLLNVCVLGSHCGSVAAVVFFVCSSHSVYLWRFSCSFVWIFVVFSSCWIFTTSSRLIILMAAPGNKDLRFVTRVTSGTSSHWNFFWFHIHTMTRVRDNVSALIIQPDSVISVKLN